MNLSASLGAIHNHYTIDAYIKALALFINFTHAKTVRDLCRDTMKIEDDIIDWISFEKRDGVRPATIKNRRAGVKLFYEMNRKPLSWTVVTKTIPA